MVKNSYRIDYNVIFEVYAQDMTLDQKLKSIVKNKYFLISLKVGILVNVGTLIMNMKLKVSDGTDDQVELSGLLEKINNANKLNDLLKRPWSKKYHQCVRARIMEKLIQLPMCPLCLFCPWTKNPYPDSCHIRLYAIRLLFWTFYIGLKSQ
ncbi:MAG: hypothetical protein EZS28_050355 [Streblomastix strix]|uniref:Uncharacterized protein n=1 Tax=Streblomastix strix TaxID=222440 RepID=A0A5J4T7D6_9EUKA|nr:MAG: hypothetical protein EZS28_050355 [Streblomastix strix]